MTKSCADHTTITIQTIRTIQIPIIVLGCGIVMVTLLVFVWVGTLAHAEEQPVRMSHSAEMIGKLVKTTEGKHLGTIKDLVINWRSGGYIEYAVLSFGGYFGLGEEYVAVPWEALTLSDQKEHFVLNVKDGHLKDVPGSVVHRFYDRSSATQRGGRSTAAPSVHSMKSDIGSDLNVSVAKSFDRQYVIEAEFHR